MKQQKVCVDVNLTAVGQFAKTFRHRQNRRPIQPVVLCVPWSCCHRWFGLDTLRYRASQTLHKYHNRPERPWTCSGKWLSRRNTLTRRLNDRSLRFLLVSALYLAVPAVRICSIFRWGKSKVLKIFPSQNDITEHPRWRRKESKQVRLNLKGKRK